MLAGSTVLGGGVTVFGRWLLAKARGQEAEVVRVWARLEAEEKKRRALEEDVQRILAERIELLEQIAESTAVVQHATMQHRREVERFEAELAGARAAHADCDRNLAELREKVRRLTQKVGRVDREIKRARRESEPAMKAQRETDDGSE